MSGSTHYLSKEPLSIEGFFLEFSLARKLLCIYKFGVFKKKLQLYLEHRMGCARDVTVRFK